MNIQKLFATGCKQLEKNQPMLFTKSHATMALFGNQRGRILTIAPDVLPYINMVSMMSQDELKKIFEAIGAQDLSPEDQQETLPAIIDHFNDIITETFVANLDDEDLKAFRTLAENSPPDFEQQVEHLAARVPGLAQKIQEAVQNEIEVVKTMYAAARTS